MRRLIAIVVSILITLLALEFQAQTPPAQTQKPPQAQAPQTPPAQTQKPPQAQAPQTPPAQTQKPPQAQAPPAPPAQTQQPPQAPAPPAPPAQTPPPRRGRGAAAVFRWRSSLRGAGVRLVESLQGRVPSVGSLTPLERWTVFFVAGARSVRSQRYNLEQERECVGSCAGWASSAPF